MVGFRIASWADGMATAAARLGLGGKEPASTGDTRNLKAMPFVDEGPSRLGAGENNAHVGAVKLGGIRPAPDGSHRELCVAEQGTSPVVVVTAFVNGRSVNVNVDVGTVTSRVCADVGDDSAPPNASPGRAAWARGRGRVVKLGEGTVVIGLRLVVPFVRRCGLVERPSVPKHVEVVLVVVAPDLRVGVIVIAQRAAVVHIVIVIGRVMSGALAGAGGGGIGMVSGARRTTSLVLEDDAMRAVP